jgi:hypothetical protein
VLQSYEIEEIINSIFDVKIPEYPQAISDIFNAIMRKVSATGHDRAAHASTRTAWLLSRKAQELAIERYDLQGVDSSFRRLFGGKYSEVL